MGGPDQVRLAALCDVDFLPVPRLILNVDVGTCALCGR